MKIHHVGYLTKNLNKSKFLFEKLGFIVEKEKQMERILIRKGWKLQGPDKRELEIQEMPSQVHDILLDYELISNPNLTGINKDQWIGEKEWCYRTEFEVEDSSGDGIFGFRGLIHLSKYT